MADSPIVHWFPGHMAKATRMITEYIKKVDVVIELLDARIPRSSANPVITELVGQKPHIVLLNKVDLADPKSTKDLINRYTSSFSFGHPIEIRNLFSKYGVCLK